MAVVLKVFREQRGNRYGILLGNYLTCIVLSFIMMPDKSGVFNVDASTLICSLIAGFLFVAGLVSMQSSIGINGAILTSAFSKSGLIVPLMISILFLGEKIRILQIPGIVLILAAFWLISTDSGSGPNVGGKKRDSENLRKTEPKEPDGAFTRNRSGISIILLLAVLLSCGGADAMAKVFEHVGSRNQDSHYFLILFVTAALLVIVLLLAEKKRTGKRIILKEFAAGILVGIPNYFSSTLLLQALSGLPAFVVYPCFSAGTLLAVTLIAAAVFQERPGVKTWCGLGMIAAALILLNQ